MSKDLWKVFMATNPEWMLAAKTGALGEDAKKAEEELESELGPFFAVLGGLIVFGLAVWGLLSLLGIV